MTEPPDSSSVPASWLGKDEEYLDFTATAAIRDDLLTKEQLIAKFDAGNYTVFACMLLVSALIGVFFWWRGKNNT